MTKWIKTKWISRKYPDWSREKKIDRKYREKPRRHSSCGEKRQKSDIHVIKLLEDEKEDSKKVAENAGKLLKVIKPQMQVLQTPRKVNPKKNACWHIILQPLKKRKELLQSSQRKADTLLSWGAAIMLSQKTEKIIWHIQKIIYIVSNNRVQLISCIL